MANLYGPRIVTDGLVFNMDFGNSKCYPGTGSGCYNLSGESISPGELINTPVFNSSTNNKYFEFNGTTNSRLIRIPNSTNLDTQTPSVEVWIKTNATNQAGFWFEKGTVNTQYSLFQQGTTIVWRQMVPTFTDLGVSSSLININNWYQIVGTFTSGSQKLYINGVLVGSGTTSGTILTNTGGMSIGAYGGYNGSRGYYYNGNIAIVKVYNKELSSMEILQNYNALKGRFQL